MASQPPKPARKSTIAVLLPRLTKPLWVNDLRWLSSFTILWLLVIVALFDASGEPQRHFDCALAGTPRSHKSHKVFSPPPENNRVPARNGRTGRSRHRSPACRIFSFQDQLRLHFRVLPRPLRAALLPPVGSRSGRLAPRRAGSRVPGALPRCSLMHLVLLGRFSLDLRRVEKNETAHDPVAFFVLVAGFVAADRFFPLSTASRKTTLHPQLPGSTSGGR